MSPELMRTILLALMGITALTTLTFPIMFSRYQWRETPIGRALMTESASTALAVTITFLLSFVHPPVFIRFVVYVIAFGAITAASARLTWTMLTINNADRTIAPKEKNEVRR